MRIQYKIKQYLIFGILSYTIVILLLTMFAIPFSLYYFTVTLVALFIIYMEMSLRSEMKRKEEEYRSLDWLLSEIRHRYYVHVMVDEAMKEAMDVCKDKKLRHKINRMIEVLSSAYPKISSEIFKKEIDNR
jgi:hypothetical protein